ncbi:MAG: PaaI family thioesterase [Pseudomonadota bacterium]
MTDPATPPLPGYTIYDAYDPFETRAGPFWWSRLEDGTDHFVLQAAEQHCNSHGIVHGGLMMTMIDLALVAVSKAETRDRFVTVSLNSEFISSGRKGDLIEARGRLNRRGRSLAFAQGQVTTADRILLTASAVLKPIHPAG